MNLDNLIKNARSYFSSKAKDVTDATNFTVNNLKKSLDTYSKGVQVADTHPFSLKNLQKDASSVISTIAKQPLNPQLNIFNQVTGGKTFNPNIGDATGFLASIPQSIARRGFEGAQTLAGDKNVYTPKAGLEQFVLGRDKLYNMTDTRRTGSQLLRDIGFNDSDVLKFTPLLAGLATAVDVTPLGMGKSKLVKEGVEQVAKVGVEDVAKQTAKKKLTELLTYKSDLVNHMGYTSAQAEKVGYAEYKNIISNVTSGRTTKEILDEAQHRMNPVQKVGQSINEVATNIKNRVHLFDYLRTPDRVLQKMGLGNEAKFLRTKYDDYLSELPVELQKVTSWAKRAPLENVQIFKWLDGNKGVTLSPEAQAVAFEIKDYLKDWTVRLKLPESKQISSYINHIFAKGEIEKDFDPELAKLIRGKVAGSVYNPFLEKRMGQVGYVQDTWQSLDAYIKRATRKVNIDPALEQISQKAEDMEDSQYKYVKSYIDRVNLRPTDLETALDTFIKAHTPIGYKAGARPVTAITQGMRQMVYRGTLGLNPATALKNLSQGANTYAELGEKYTMLGYAKVAQNLPKLLANLPTELENTGVLHADFIQDRTLNATKKFWSNLDAGIFYMFQFAEKVNRGAAFWGAKSKALAQGMTEAKAIDYAKDVVRKTQFTFGSVDTPVALQDDIMKTLLQLQSYTLKQSEFLGERIAKKDVAGMVRWALASTAFLLTIGKVIGMEPKDMIPAFRFGTPPALQVGQGAIEAVTKDEDQFGNKLDMQHRILNKNLTTGATNYIPAGAQLRKMFAGTQAVAQGGSYTESGKLRFPVDNAVQTIMFGPNASQTAKDYYNNGSPLGDKQTATYQSLVASGMSNAEAYNVVTEGRGADTEFTKRINAEAQPQSTSLTDHVGSFFTNLFGGKKTTDKPQSNDPLTRIFNEEVDSDETASKIKEIFKLNLSKEDTERVLKQENLGTFEEASITILKSLSVENNNRGRALLELTKDMDEDSKEKSLFYYASQKVLTSGVVDAWEESGEITSETADALKIMIKMSTGKYKPKAAPKVNIKQVTLSGTKLDIPSAKGQSLSFKPLQHPKIKFSVPAVSALRQAKADTNLKYEKSINKLFK